MDPISAIVAVVVAGATAALKETAGKAVKDSYEALKGFLASRLSSLGLLEENPTEAAFQKAAEAEIRNKGLEKEPGLAERVQALETAIAQEPASNLAAWGIDVANIHAATDVIVKNLTSQADAVRVRDLEARAGRVEVEGITAGGQPKNS
jgi:hypothetical protein